MRFVPLVLLAAAVVGGEAPLLVPAGSIALPEVKGRIDHAALDRSRHRLFVAALGNGSVEVVDVGQEVVVQRLTGLAEPQGVAYVPDLDHLFVSCGEGGRIEVFAAADLKPAGSIPTRSDPDNLRYDPASKLLYVGHGGDGDGAIGVIDPAAARSTGDIGFGGHPEAFAFEPDGDRLFVNVPDRGVVVVDRVKRSVTATWKLPAKANYPMAFAAQRGRLLVGCRRPSTILVLDTGNGEVVDRIDGPGDVDDLWFDARRDRVYATGGDGVAMVLAAGADGRFTLVERTATARGARTSFFDAEADRLYVLAPAADRDPARVIILTIR